jgi:sugar lactone lactonase YvrE
MPDLPLNRSAEGGLWSAKTSFGLCDQGNLFIADMNNNRVRKVAPNGTISTVAGNGIAGYSGDSDSAAAAQLNNPRGVAVDTSGNLYISDANNNRIRKVATNGIISTVAGSGASSFSGMPFPSTSVEVSTTGRFSGVHRG